MAPRDTFAGEILGVGTSHGTRIVVGHWHTTPMGPFSDVMVESAAGHRVLVSPNAGVQQYVSGIYTFDELRLEPVDVTTGPGSWKVRADSVRLDVRVGGTTPVGRLLRLVPRRVGQAPWFTAVTDPVARVLLPGVRTRGQGADGTRRWYAAHAERRVVALTRAEVDATSLGQLADIDPVHFGFGSTPSTPSVVTITSVVERRR